MKSYISLIALFGLFFQLACENDHSSAADQSKDNRESSMTIHPRTETSPAYLSCGSGDTTLIFVHGWGIHKGYWQNQIEVFCPDYQVIAIDLPGFHDGDTSRTGLSVKDYGATLAKLIDQQKLNKVVLIGHSMGGNVILEAANQIPQAIIGLIGVDNFKGVGEEQPEEVDQFIADFLVQLENDFVATVNFFSNQFLFHESTDSLIKERVLADIFSADRRVVFNSLKLFFTEDHQEIEKLKQLGKKLYLLNSDAIPTNPEIMQEAGVAVEVIPVGTTGHYPMIENPEVFNTALRKVLKRI